MLRIVELSSNSVHCQSGNKDVEAQMRRWQDRWCGEANKALSGVSTKVRACESAVAFAWLAG
jgi:hypothetical protein